MNRRGGLLCIVLLGVLGASFPEPEPQDPIDLSGLAVTEVVLLDQTRRIAPGVDFADVATPHGTRLWIYRPVERGAQGSRPVVLIGPAGSSLLTGMPLAEGDRAEHLPYAKAGFVVVAYSLDGPGDSISSMRAFARAKAGLLNAREARRVVDAIPEADAQRIFAVGHSSAGDLALLVGSHLDVAGVVAFNTAGKGCWIQSAEWLEQLAGDPAMVAFCQETRAAGHLGHVREPTLLFGSPTDQVVRYTDVRRLRDAMKEAGVPVELQTGRGDHYSSMIEFGIPKALRWMKAQSERPTPPEAPSKE